MIPPPASEAERLEREAARTLADAIGLIAAGREPDRRERHRQLLERAIDQAARARGTNENEPRGGALAILAEAHAARAEDALHGAGQLSLSAQRAPTLEGCDEGWQRVETIVAFAEEAARAAESAARLLEPGSAKLTRKAHAAAARAAVAAGAARRLVDERNHAYTFHTDYGFSFGEGWSVAAAAVLSGVAIQIEPGKPATVQAERFLRDAGLGARLQPCRARPRANKQTTAIVARAFRADPPGTQRKLRTAFLGDAPMGQALRDWIDPRLAGYGDHPKVLVWTRHGAHQPARNTGAAEVAELTERLLHAGVLPVLVGDAPRGGDVPARGIDLVLFWKDPIFRGDDARRAQLALFEHLRRAHGVIGQLGVTTAGMDGPALMGMPTIYFTEEPNVRMRAWVGTVPGYQEIVRDSGYLEKAIARVTAWTSDRRR
jgi:hypothetical protein